MARPQTARRGRVFPTASRLAPGDNGGGCAVASPGRVPLARYYGLYGRKAWLRSYFATFRPSTTPVTLEKWSCKHPRAVRRCGFGLIPLTIALVICSVLASKLPLQGSQHRPDEQFLVRHALLDDNFPSACCRLSSSRRSTRLTGREANHRPRRSHAHDAATWTASESDRCRLACAKTRPGHPTSVLHTRPPMRQRIAKEPRPTRESTRGLRLDGDRMDRRR
jgi:hypothetical protein